MPIPNINDLAKEIINKGSISKQDLMKDYDLNRFQAHKLLIELYEKGIIEKNFDGPFSIDSWPCNSTVSKQEIDYLKIDMSNFDFNTKSIKQEKMEKLEERLPQNTAMGGLDFYGAIMYPVDGNEIRMRCGDLKPGDKFTCRTQEHHEHPIYGWKRTDTFGYEFCYCGHKEMNMLENNRRQYEWKIDENQNGWGFTWLGQENVADWERKEVQILHIPEKLFGQPVVNADFAFADTREHIIVQSLPNTITSARGLCYNSFITKTPTLSDNIENLEMAFSKCGFLEKIEKLPSRLKPEHTNDMFTDCPHLSNIELAKIPDGIDLSMAVKNCGSKIIDDHGVLDEQNNAKNNTIKENNQEKDMTGFEKDEDDLSL